MDVEVTSCRSYICLNELLHFLNGVAYKLYNFIYISKIEIYNFQEQRTSQLPLELDQLGDDSASMRSDADVQSKYDLYYIYLILC